MKPRQVLKYDIERSEVEELSQKLKPYVDVDRHAIDGKYTVRSLYFDDENDTGFNDRKNNAANRQLYRIRYYNNDPSFIRLEKKIKENNIGEKKNFNLTIDQVNQIINNDFEWMTEIEDDLIKDFYYQIKEKGLHPKVIVEYTRYPYTYNEDEVRFTLDYDISSSEDLKNFLNKEINRKPLDDTKAIIEVKWVGELPQVIIDAAELDKRESSQISKYVANRENL